MFFFFFSSRRRHTRLTCDWSSDVCSSDLYKAGWRGINIDPRPGMTELFGKYRSEDTNIEAGVAERPGEMTYYVVEEGSTMRSEERRVGKECRSRWSP